MEKSSFRPMDEKMYDKKTWVVLQNNNKKERDWLVAFKDE